MANIRLLVCDLDGTLLDDDKCITDRTREALLQARRAGMGICFASGRNEQMMSIYCDAIGNCDYLIADNGALARCGCGGDILWECCLTPGQGRQLLRYLWLESVEFVGYTPDSIFYSAGSARMEKRFAGYEALSRRMGYPKRLAKTPVDDPSQIGCARIRKLVAYEEDAEKAGAFKAYVDSIPGLCHEATGYGLTGAFAASVSKRAALEAVMRHAGVGSDAVCVFGDYGNDLSLFSCAGTRVAMGNAIPQLKEHATHVTDSNNRDGVANYIQQQLLHHGGEATDHSPCNPGG